MKHTVLKMSYSNKLIKHRLRHKVTPLHLRLQMQVKKKLEKATTTTQFMYIKIDKNKRPNMHERKVKGIMRL